MLVSAAALSVEFDVEAIYKQTAGAAAAVQNLLCPAPSALRFCTFILIDEAILVINGSYYTRLDRTFSFYRGPV